ncbi:MAG TPA: alpha/beta fold hydrolase [Burkholderiales bacterium]|nr:alpha/beta fold hydrolase [Burkholderiales bacterium]
MAIEIRRALIGTSFGQIHCRTAGTGPAIVLLHINQQSSAVFIEMIESLAPRMRAIAIDYPSHGGSDHVAKQPTIADYARCVVAVMDALGVGKFIALGEATGAVVAVELAASHPDRVGRIVLVNCPFLDPQLSVEALIAPFQAKFRPSDESGFPTTRTVRFMLEEDPDHAPLRPTQSWMDRINRAQIEVGRDRWQALTALKQYDLARGLERIRCPALLLMGEHFYLGKSADEIRKRLKDLRYELLPDTRFCAGWERASEIARLAIEFAGA